MPRERSAACTALRHQLSGEMSEFQGVAEMRAGGQAAPTRAELVSGTRLKKDLLTDRGWWPPEGALRVGGNRDALG